MWIVIATAVAFSTSASAASGSFTNNVASDLGPLIALFGEQVTMQFLRSSFTIFDSILFAMAPIGVLTAISAAIRVGDISSLKTLIGRARESKESVEVDVLSSTSQAICEVWGGQELVRVQKDGSVLEIVYYERDSTLEEDDPKQRICSRDNLGLRELKPSFWGIRRDIPPKSAIGNIEAGSEKEKSSAAPNISLNYQDLTQYSPMFDGMLRVNLLLATAFGVVLQAGVLVYFWVLTFILKLRGSGGGSYSVVGLDLAFSGTLFLVMGMFTCANVIEQTTRKKVWDTNRWNENGAKKFRLFWLQYIYSH